jgi:hypothetical protein
MLHHCTIVLPRRRLFKLHYIVVDSMKFLYILALLFPSTVFAGDYGGWAFSDCQNMAVSLSYKNQIPGFSSGIVNFTINYADGSPPFIDARAMTGIQSPNGPSTVRFDYHQYNTTGKYAILASASAPKYQTESSTITPADTCFTVSNTTVPKPTASSATLTPTLAHAKGPPTVASKSGAAAQAAMKLVIGLVGAIHVALEWF